MSPSPQDLTISDQFHSISGYLFRKLQACNGLTVVGIRLISDPARVSLWQLDRRDQQWIPVEKHSRLCTRRFRHLWRTPMDWLLFAEDVRDLLFVVSVVFRRSTFNAGPRRFHLRRNQRRNQRLSRLSRLCFRASGGGA